MFDFLPSELVCRVYEFDSSYHNYFKIVVLEELVYIINTVKYLLLESISLLISEHYLKKMVRCFLKSELRYLAKFLKIKLPRRFTKKKVLLTILWNLLLRGMYSYLILHQCCE